jgi:hypothetical protein
MRTHIWLLLALLVVLICGCGAKDPIIGKWADSKTGESLIEFKDDGSVIYDVDTDKVAARVLLTHPEWAERLKAQAGPWHERMRSQKASWTRNGDTYAVKLEVLGSTLTPHYKLDQGNLKDCNNQRSDRTYVPVKK